MRAAVDRRRGVLELLGPARPESGRRGVGLGGGWPGVGAATPGTLASLAPLVSLAPLATLATLATLAPLATLAALGTLAA